MLDKIKTLREIIEPSANELGLSYEEMLANLSEEDKFNFFERVIIKGISGHYITSNDLSKVTFNTLKKYLKCNYYTSLNMSLYKKTIIQFNNELNERNSQSVKSWQDYSKTKKHKYIAKNNGNNVGKKYKGKFFKEWEAKNPEQADESRKRGALTKCYNDMANGTGLFSMTKEERSVAGTSGNKSFWNNATQEEIKAKYDKASKSMKKVVEERGWWNPHECITEELRLDMTNKMKKTKKNQKVKKLEELYNRVDHHNWMTMEEAHEIILRYRTASVSTSRRMFYSWEEAKQFFEIKYIPNRTNNGQKNILIRKLDISNF